MSYSGFSGKLIAAIQTRCTITEFYAYKEYIYIYLEIIFSYKFSWGKSISFLQKRSAYILWLWFHRDLFTVSSKHVSYISIICDRIVRVLFFFVFHDPFKLPAVNWLDTHKKTSPSHCCLSSCRRLSTCSGYTAFTVLVRCYHDDEYCKMPHRPASRRNKNGFSSATVLCADLAHSRRFTSELRTRFCTFYLYYLAVIRTVRTWVFFFRYRCWFFFLNKRPINVASAIKRCKKKNLKRVTYVLYCINQIRDGFNVLNIICSIIDLFFYSAVRTIIVKNSSCWNSRCLT